LEAKYWHLPMMYFHGGFQRVMGEVDEFTELIRGTTNDKYSYQNVKSRGKEFRFSEQIGDLRMKCCIDYSA